MTTPSSITRRFSELSDSARRDPDASWATLGYGALSWDEVLQSPRVLLISEAGTGKTYETQGEQKRRLGEGQPTFWIELSTLGHRTLRETLGGHDLRRFDEWFESPVSVATFFLDSVDELLLTKGSFTDALKTVSRGVAGRLERARFVVTSRPTEFDRQALIEHLPVPEHRTDPSRPRQPGQGFMDLVKRKRPNLRNTVAPKEPPSVRTVALVPLTIEEMQTFVAARGVTNPAAFTQALIEKDALSFARRPMDLIELAAGWRAEGRLLSHREQIATNIKVKLRDAEKRHERPLSQKKGLEGAQRLALAMLLTRRLTLRYASDSDTEPSPDTVLEPSDILTEWNSGDIKALLERPLFSHAGYGRARFHHRSVLEFLAAEALHRLLEAGVPQRNVLSTLFATTPQQVDVLKPALRPTAVWLAARQAFVFSEIVHRQPEALLQYGDPEQIPEGNRLLALEAYISRVAEHQYEGIEFPYEMVQRMVGPTIVAAMVERWHRGIANPDVRRLLLQCFRAHPTSDGNDIAFAVAIEAIGDDVERIWAIDALLASNDARSAIVADSLVHDAANWPERIAGTAALRLVPNHLSPVQLCAILARTTSKRDVPGRNLIEALAREVANGQLSFAYLTKLRNGVFDEVLISLTWNKNQFPHFQALRPELVRLLADICAQQLTNTRPTLDLFCATVVATLFLGHGTDRNGPITALRRQAGRWAPGTRQAAFTVAHMVLMHVHAEADAWDRYHTISEAGLLALNAEQDGEWLLAVTENPNADSAIREATLEGVFRGNTPIGLSRSSLVRRLQPAIAGIPTLETCLQKFRATLAYHAKDQRQYAARVRQQQREEERDAEHNQAWEQYLLDIAEDPDLMFGPKRRRNTVINLWSLMGQIRDTGDLSGWNRAFLEREYSVDVAERMKAALMGIWRTETPTLPYERPPEERGTVLTVWMVGNDGLTAESETPGWAERLDTQEARQAARYTPMESNRLPPWLPDLATAHPEPVRATLVQLLDDELAHLHDPKIHPTLMQHLMGGDASTIALAMPHLEAWLQTQTQEVASRRRPTKPTYGAQQLLELLLAHGTPAAKKQLQDLSLKALARSVGTEWAVMCFHALFSLDPASATTELERRLGRCAIRKVGKGAAAIGALFGDRFERMRVNPKGAGFTADLLLRLVRLAYTHVRRDDDLERSGSFTPDARDGAENGRGALLSALLDAPGPDAWDAKMALASDPIIGAFADRARAISVEHAAIEAEGPPMSLMQVGALAGGTTVPPLTRDQMFTLLQHRLHDLDDLLRQDYSPREMWAAVTDEHQMRRLIVGQLEQWAKGAYKTNQEEVTADEKETDIRLASTASRQVGVIELKVGKSWSGRQLLDTIEHQLVTMYLRHDHRKSGFLLVTVGADRTWHHPETNEVLDVLGLEAILNEESARVAQRHGHAIKIGAKVLDLRPPGDVFQSNPRHSKARNGAVADSTPRGSADARADDHKNAVAPRPRHTQAKGKSKK